MNVVLSYSAEPVEYVEDYVFSCEPSGCCHLYCMAGYETDVCPKCG